MLINLKKQRYHEEGDDIINTNVNAGVSLMNIEFNNLDGSYPLKFYDIGLNWVQHKVYRPRGFEYYHWLQTDKGRGVVKIGANTFYLEENQGFFIRPNVAYTCYPDSKEWITSFFTFEGTLSKDICDFLGLNDFQIYKNINFELKNFIKNNYSIFSKTDYSSSLDQSALVYQFLMILKKNAYIGGLYFTQSDIVNRINEYIRTNYREKISNNDLSELTEYSISQMIKLYKAEVKETPMEFLMKYRLRMAKELLDFNPELSIKEISEMVGYSNPSYFVDQYKRFFSVTPGKEQRKK